MPITIIDEGYARYCCGIKKFQKGSEISDDIIDRMIESYLDRWDPYDYGR